MKFICSIVLLVISLAFARCTDKEKTIDVFESDVFSEVFPQIVDSIFIDKRTMLPPMLPSQIHDANSKFPIDETIDYQNYKPDHIKKFDSIKNTDSTFLIVVEAKQRLQSSPFIRNINRFNNKRFVYKLVSEFNNYENILSSTAGIVRLSPIKFDEYKINGILNVEFIYDPKAGNAFNIKIKQINNKWVITKIEITGIY